MSLDVDATTTVKCRAITADPDFIDVTGERTGTIGGTYKPIPGHYGHMAYGDAEPLDIGVPTTGDKLAICFKHTPLQIEKALETAGVITPRAPAGAFKPKPTRVEVPIEPDKRRPDKSLAVERGPEGF